MRRCALEGCDEVVKILRAQGRPQKYCSPAHCNLAHNRRTYLKRNQIRKARRRLVKPISVVLADPISPEELKERLEIQRIAQEIRARVHARRAA